MPPVRFRRFFARFLGVLLLALGVSGSATPAPAQVTTIQTRQVMREKLALSQVLLASVVTSDWALLNKNTQDLLAVTKKPGWQVLQAPEYLQRTSEFFDAAKALGDAALQRDSRGAAAAYNKLVASCVECHRFVALSRQVGK